jgi:uncharacterized PurR-regulated membrane protein YhhQ (DUF165 family)
MHWVIAYVGSIALVNWGFSTMPGWELLWSAVVGFVFVLRDLVQRRYGHKVLLAMLVAAGLSYLTADPFVATASVAAFLVSEAADWLVYTWTKRPLADRVLLSSAVSVPLDSLVFLGLIGLLIPQLIAVQIVSKFAAALVVWAGLKVRA